MLPSFSSAPSGRVERDIWYRSDTKKVWYQDDTWPHELWSGSTGGADIGTMAYGLSAPNADYLPCDWAPLSQSTYSDLYAQVGINPSFTAWVGKTIPGMQWFIDIAYSSSLGKYVGITSSVLSISSDGVNWNVMTPKIWGSLASVTWCSGLGMFVVGSGNFCYTSTDGISWIPSYINANVNVTLVAASSSTIVAIGADSSDNSIQYLWTSTDGVSWTRRTGAWTGITWTALHYSAGLGLWAAGSSTGVIHTSTNGTTWSARTSNVSQQINRFDSHASMIVAVANAGQIASSPDGTTWTSRTTQTTIALNGVAYSSTATIPWVAVGAGVLMTSTNGTTWLVQQASLAGKKNICWNWSKYVRVSELAGSATSTDFDTWTAYNPIYNSYALTSYNVIFANSVFVQTGSSGSISSSTDGQTWTVRTSGVASHIRGLIWDSTNSLFIATGASNIMVTSPNGTTWTTRTATGTFNDIATNGSGVSVAVGDSWVIFSSSNGTSWTSRTSNTTKNLSGVAWNGTKFVAFGTAGIIVTSTDGTTWTRENPADLANTTINNICSNGTNFYVTSSARNAVGVSSDGVSWTFYVSPVIFSSIQYMNSKFIAYSSTGELYSSSDAITWVKSASSEWVTTYIKVFWLSGASKFYSSFNVAGGSGSSSTDGKVWKSIYGQAIQDMAYSASQTRSVAVWASGGILTSADGGATWAYVYDFTCISSISFIAVSYSSSLDMFVAVGTGWLIATSTNGTTWTQRQYTQTGSQGLYTDFTDIDWSSDLGMFVAVWGAWNIATSTNWTTWTKRTCPVYSNLNAVAWNDSLGMFVAVGSNGTVVSSTNGTSWTFRQSNTTWVFTQVASLEAKGFIAWMTLYWFMRSADWITWVWVPTPAWATTTMGKMFYSSVDGWVFALGTNLPTSNAHGFFTRDWKTLEILSVWNFVISSSSGFIGTVYDSDEDKILYMGVTSNTNTALVIASRTYDKATEFILPSIPNTFIKYQ